MTETIIPIDDLITAVEKADSAPKLFLAVSNLAKVRSPLAIPTLIEVLGYNNPGAAVAATEGLIAIGKPAVTSLLENVDDYNYGARAWAIRVFAGIGDPRALQLLLKAASSDFSLSVRRAATKGLGSITWSEIPPENRPQAQQKVLDTLLITAQDGEWVVRYATVVSLGNLYQAVDNQNMKHIIQKTLINLKEDDEEIAIQTRSTLALRHLT
ncbi:HEAT repeat domain-containing protein [Cyanobacterium stanieri LEGE 03274]|uniref:HEAT repeat domain-containing protein n=1 Tax=Cyanobacterium stanieri LEGE 03274 TaxID=1828756 RepID=A0ABR9V737_9CHRO|nr:HEAT repeat domain-containing protein [Cyanobacterium stanieri]MBE9223344.1 HEAT repeat domain-containing protein [Cyanobacterium stanieri LEGE 03274]